MQSMAFPVLVSTTEAKEYFANAKNKVIDKKEEDIKTILEKAPCRQGKQREFSQQMS